MTASSLLALLSAYRPAGRTMILAGNTGGVKCRRGHQAAAKKAAARNKAAVKKAKAKGNAVRNKFLVPLVTAGALTAAAPKAAEADALPAATMTDRVPESSRGVDPPQRLTDAPATDVRAAATPTSRIGSPAPVVRPAPAVARPAASAPKTGTVTVDRVTIDYDLRNADSKRAFKVRSMDFSGFPTKDSKLVRFSQSPYVKAGTTVALVLLSLYVERPIFPLDIIKAHFSSVIRSALERLDQLYPPPAGVLADANLDEREETFRIIREALEDESYLAAKTKEQIVADLDGVFEYQDALVAAYERVMKQLLPELPAIYNDITKRADVLGRIARNLESVMVQIHTRLIGAMPIVYYESFTIWSVRTVMLDLSQQMSGLGGAVYSRQAEYVQLAEKLDQKRLAADATFKWWRDLYEKNRRLISK